MMKVAVAGASGYAGGELLRLLAGHPEFQVVIATAAANAGQRLADVHPQLATAYPDLTLGATNPQELAEADLIFLALPHGASAAVVAALPPTSRVVDLGADFRLDSADAWRTFYGSEHAGVWPYGLPELVDRAQLAAATRIANPGCYPTSVALGLAPLVAHVDLLDVVVVAASGTSGAGRKPTESLLATEVMGSMSAYKVGGVHQHTPEMEQTISRLAGSDVRLSFTPLLAPMSRGILATITARLTAPISDAHALLADFYAGEPFVQVLPKGRQPATAAVYGSNSVHMQAMVDPRTERVVITVAIDNLVKGAAGQALQNANIMCGFDETTALPTIGVAP